MKSVAGRFVWGLIKGAIVGGGVGYGLIRFVVVDTASFDSLWRTVIPCLACGLVGAVVGVVAGRAPWRAETIWTPVLKMVVGAVIGAVLAYVGVRFLPDRTFAITGLGNVGLTSAPVLSVVVGLLYGLFVEIDDGGDEKPGEQKAPLKKRSRG